MKIELPIFDSEVKDLKEAKLVVYGGIYCFYGYDKELLYIGKSKSIGERIVRHRTEDDKRFISMIENVRLFQLDCEADREIYETYLINKWHPTHNQSKTYTYKASYHIRDLSLATIKGKPTATLPFIMDYLQAEIHASRHGRVTTSFIFGHFTKLGYDTSLLRENSTTIEGVELLEARGITYKKGYYVRTK